MWQIRGPDMVMFLTGGAVVTLRRDFDRDDHDTRQTSDSARQGDWTAWFYDGSTLHPPLARYWTLRSGMQAVEAILSRLGVV